MKWLVLVTLAAAEVSTAPAPKPQPGAALSAPAKSATPPALPHATHSTAAASTARALLERTRPSLTLLREAVAETAVAQAMRPDPRWVPEQRDCAGLIRFSYRTAYARLRHQREPLWRGGKNEPLAFADAETLLTYNFQPIAEATLSTGDLLAYRQETPSGPLFHLMLVVKPVHGATRIVYHPGEPGASVRVGTFDSLSTEAPREWRPRRDNAAFLGFFRFKEWMHEP
ncbi:MAG: DUF1175 family protein [Myxococcaceae bacterium]